MIRKIESKTMGKGNHGWLNSIFHFSFAEYYNRQNMNFGVLRVLNDDLVKPNTGFDPHPHRDMEIISYVVKGQLTHGDNMGNQRTLSRGDVQYMSAGTGVIHSEHNRGNDELRFLQLWIMPEAKSLKPAYGDYRFEDNQRFNKWLTIVSSKKGNAPITINQDVVISVAETEANKTLYYPLKQNRQAYLVLIEGKAVINHKSLNERDALEAIEEDLHIQSLSPAHYLIVEMEKQ